MNQIRAIFNNQKSKWILFALFLTLLILDRIFTLSNFGFVYSDIDELVMWEGAMNYSKGIFHEPFFYGQSYNYMVESFLCVPLIWMGVPIYYALPIISAFLAIFPFVTLAIFFVRNNQSFWACVALSVSILLPLEYNFMTTIPRGFLQAHLFIPLLYFALFNPTSKRNITLLYIGSALSFIANQSSIIFILPIVLYVWTFNLKSFSFYLKPLLTLPILALDYYAKQFYVIHPEKIRHDMVGLEINRDTFWETFGRSNLFEYLAPFNFNGALFYLIAFILLIVIAIKFKAKKEWILLSGSLFTLLITFAIPKVQEPFPLENASVYFSVSRLYLFLPLIIIIQFFFLLKNRKSYQLGTVLLFGSVVLFFLLKNYNVSLEAHKIITKTTFPVEPNKDLIQRSNRLKQIVEDKNIDLMVFTAGGEKYWWSNLMDSYAYNPLQFRNSEPIRSVFLDNDRRTWMYDESKSCNNMLIFGMIFQDSITNQFTHEYIDSNILWIQNNSNSTDSLMQQLDLYFGLK